MFNLFIDLYPIWIPVFVQCTKADGTKVNPTVDNLIVYELDGAEEDFAPPEIPSSPFDPSQVNLKTGLWGAYIPTSQLTAGKFYVALWEMTVDGVATAKVDFYFACNSANFKADLSGLATEANATANKNALDALMKYLNGKTDFNVAAVAVPARKVEVGMLDTIDMWISATQKLHIELTYDADKNVISKDYTIT